MRTYSEQRLNYLMEKSHKKWSHVLLNRLMKTQDDKIPSLGTEFQQSLFYNGAWVIFKISQTSFSKHFIKFIWAWFITTWELGHSKTHTMTCTCMSSKDSDQSMKPHSMIIVWTHSAQSPLLSLHWRWFSWKSCGPFSSHIYPSDHSDQTGWMHILEFTGHMSFCRVLLCPRS